ncbi:hypothetical protein DAEQUDRAFT_723128 [Daedalea quercina L-15889]|uniref:Uncharacterized protein n=1 Tax=Daedalea quercina L-15889 TaxID=1314783 RepID=A0A165SS90_9APHY|nr:hypothetical protein DAEQUDRAFT_723128 [Daedalea quercina L-15889]
MPRLLLLLAYVAAGMYPLEESLGGPLFYDPFARISWLMERGWIDTMPMAQEFLILYLWAWWKVVGAAERTRVRIEMGVGGVCAVGEWVLHDKDDGAHLRTSGADGLTSPWSLKVLKWFDEDYLQTRKLVDRDPRTGARQPYVKPETTLLYGDLD